MTQVSAIRVDLTPRKGTALAGYAGPPRIAKGVAEPLEANILQLEVDGRDLFLVAIDSLYGGCLGERLEAELGCESGRVVVLGSHTHFAPGLDPELVALGGADPAYLSWVTTRIAEGISELTARIEMGASYGESRTQGLFVNRRVPVLGRWLTSRIGGPVRAAPNLLGDVDETVRVVLLRGETGIEAVLWSSACHPVCAPERDDIGANYPGFVRETIRESLGRPDLPVLFMQGFSGDVRPASYRVPSRRSIRGLAQYALNHGRTFVPQHTAAYQDWCNSLARHVLAAIDVAFANDGVKLDPSFLVASRTPAGWARGVRIVELSLQSEISLYMVNAEVMSARVADLLHRSKHVVPVGCVGEVVGYWPSDHMLRERGYEGCESLKYFPVVDWRADSPNGLWRELLDDFELG